MSKKHSEGFSDIPHPQKPLLTLEQLSLSCSVSEYTELLEWVTENCQSMKLSNDTKSHTRVYFDVALAASYDIPLERYTPLLIASLALAIKVHQKRSISDMITPQKLMNGVGLMMTNSDFCQFQVYVFQALQFQMKFKSPQDYLDEFLRIFPYKRNAFKKALPSVIDLALVHPRASQFEAKSLFFGAVLAAMKIVPLNLEDQEFNELLKLTDDWNTAQVICQLIEEQAQITDDESQQE